MAAKKRPCFVTNWWSGTVHAGCPHADQLGDASIEYDGLHVSTACRRQIGLNADAYVVSDVPPENPTFCKLRRCKKQFNSSTTVVEHGEEAATEEAATGTAKTDDGELEIDFRSSGDEGPTHGEHNGPQTDHLDWHSPWQRGKRRRVARDDGDEGVPPEER